MTTLKTETVTLRMRPDIKAALRRVAVEEHRSLANMVEVMIRDYCRRSGDDDGSSHRTLWRWRPGSTAATDEIRRHRQRRGYSSQRQEVGIMAYPGGKAGPGTYRHLIDRMPPHRVYIEPFPGAGAALRHKRPAQENIGVEPDAAAIAAHHADAPPNATVIHGDGLQYLRERRWQGDEPI